MHFRSKLRANLCRFERTEGRGLCRSVCATGCRRGSSVPAARPGSRQRVPPPVPRRFCCSAPNLQLVRRQAVQSADVLSDRPSDDGLPDDGPAHDVLSASSHSSSNRELQNGILSSWVSSSIRRGVYLSIVNLVDLPLIWALISVNPCNVNKKRRKRVGEACALEPRPEICKTAIFVTFWRWAFTFPITIDFLPEMNYQCVA